MTESTGTSAGEMRPEDVPDELVRAAVKARVVTIISTQPGKFAQEVRQVLAAVLPLYERQVRERIAQDLANADEPHATWRAAIDIARGDDA